jgi:flagellar hook-associated protein 1
MSIGAIIQNSYSGLATSQAALRTISHNIANVNTPGFARLQTQLSSVTLGGIGSGVRVAQITRAADRFLEQHALSATSDSVRAQVVADFQGRMQSLLGDPSAQSGIAGRINSIQSALGALALNPADLTHARAVVSEIQGFFDEAERVSADIGALRADASTQLADTVTTINGLLERVRVLNGQVIRARVTGGDETGAAEQRAQTLQELSQLVDISSAEQNDGSIHILTRSGQTLLDIGARRLDYASPGAVGSDVNASAIKISTVNPQTGVVQASNAVLDTEASGGRVRALIDVRDKELPALQSSLGELTRVLANELNRAHNANSAAPAPPSLSGRQTGLGSLDRAGFTGKTNFAVVNSQGILLAKTTIDFASLGPSATITDVVTAINSGLGGAATAQFNNSVFSFASNSNATGVAVVEDSAQPGSRGGQGFSQFFGLNDLVRGAQPSNFDTGVVLGDAHGFGAGETLEFEVRDSNNRLLKSQTLTITGTNFSTLLNDLNAPGGIGDAIQFGLDANGKLTTTPRPGVNSPTIRVVSDSTNRNGTGVTLSNFFGLGATVLTDGARGQNIRSDIASNASLLASSKVDIALPVGNFVLGRGDFRGASALQNVFSQSYSFGAAGGLAATQTSLANYTGAIIGDSAVRAAQAEQLAQDSQALATGATEQRDSAIGVNLDEELGNLLIFQTSYNASARMMSAAKELYDTLLSLVD